MTNTETDASMSGEERLRSRKTAFWKLVAAGMAAAFGAGLASGTIQGLIGDDLILAWAIFPATGVVLAGFVWFSNAYFNKIDELDLADNLWASLIGLYFYIVGFPVWAAIHEAGFVSEPNQWAIWAATLGFTTLAYLARKLGLR